MKAHDDIAAAVSMLALITRPRDEAEALAALLAERGIAAVIEPMIEIVGRRSVLPDFAAIQAILCTSTNGVRALAQASGERAVPVFAVGDATAREARAAGFRSVESAGGNVDDLARLVSRHLRPADGRLLHAAGSDVAGDLTALLGAAGFAVERAVLYEARAAEVLTPATAQSIDEGAIDMALFFSPRTAGIFARLVEAAEIASGLASTAAVSISRAADAALGDLPFRERTTAATPTQAALLELVGELAAPRTKVPS
jgi:uroporphyrinogen-III synthase